MLGGNSVVIGVRAFFSEIRGLRAEDPSDGAVKASERRARAPERTPEIRRGA